MQIRRIGPFQINEILNDNASVNPTSSLENVLRLQYSSLIKYKGPTKPPVTMPDIIPIVTAYVPLTIPYSMHAPSPGGPV